MWVAAQVGCCGPRNPCFRMLGSRESTPRRRWSPPRRAPWVPRAGSRCGRGPRRLSFGDGEFDLVFSSMTFHHWADQRRGVAEVRRVLGADGRWMLADFVPKGLFRLVMSRRFARHPVLDRMLAEVGLGVTSQRLVAGLGRQVP